MEHFTCRCKHCGTLYTYCTYGNDYCTKEYCNTCAQAIFNILKKNTGKISWYKAKNH